MRNIKIYALQVLGFGDREGLKIPAYWEKGRTGRMRFFPNASMHNHQISISGGNEELLIHFRVVI